MDGNNNQNGTENQNLQEQQAQGEQQLQGEQQENQQIVPKESEIMKQNADMQIELRKQKKMIDQYTSQISELKKKLNEKLITEGDKITKQTEELAELKERLEKAEQKNLFRDTVDGYMALGMDKDYASKVAQMKMEGEEELVNTSIKAFLDAERKRVKEETTQELYAKMPVPASGNGDGQVDYEKQAKDRLEAGDTQGYFAAMLMAGKQVNG